MDIESYSIEELGEIFKDIYDEFLKADCEIDFSFVAELYGGIETNHNKINELISEKVKSPIKIEFIEDILYCAINEILMGKIDGTIIIDEYVGIIAYFVKPYTGLINAVLQNIYNETKKLGTNIVSIN